VTRGDTLLVFFDLPYVRGSDGIYCQDAFWIFLERVGEGFERMVVLGRVTTDAEAPRYRCCGAGGKIEFHALPRYSSLYAVGEVARSLPALFRRIWGPVGGCDAMLVASPHPWSLALWCVGKLRGKRIAFMVRQDTPAYVSHRAPARGRRLVLLGARLLEASFVRLSRSVLTFAVGDPVAARYRRARGPVHSILISTVRAETIAAPVTRAPSHPGRARLLWVGRLEPEKRPDLLLTCFRALCERRPGALELDVVGRGPLLAEAESLARRLGVSDRVRLRGYVPHGPELQRLYEAADLLVLSSASEGFPQVILEAMARGLPVVTTAAGGIPALLDDGVNAILVPCNDADALTAGVERVLDDPGLQERLRSAGLRFAREHTLELESERLLRIWDSHFREGPGGPIE